MDRQCIRAIAPRSPKIKASTTVHQKGELSIQVDLGYDKRAYRKGEKRLIIRINDEKVQLSDMEQRIAEIKEQIQSEKDKETLVAKLKVDKEVLMGEVSILKNELRQAGITKIIYQLTNPSI